MKYRKKPVIIEAFCFGRDTQPDWFRDAVTNTTVTTYAADPLIENPSESNLTHAIIKTLEGDHRAESGDYIIKGVKGELYPCKPDIFSMTYEPV